ncbi:MAG: hypothetical protein LAT55_06945 [Opitutales bacterium]|nr:hypothetical protein [Opitutales bacterium]
MHYSQPIKFEGNVSSNVGKQGKYRVKHDNGHFSVSVIIETEDGIINYPSSSDHRDLIKMVNMVKSYFNEVEGGSFYINEYGQVIVPAGDPLEYYYAGEYLQPIILSLDGEEFNGLPHDQEGNPLSPGGNWQGKPRPGIKYTLKAGGSDIEYRRKISPGREQRIKLSSKIGPAAAKKIARKISRYKGNSGGAFYVNEYRVLFGPKLKEDGYNYLFFGVLTEKDPWFPKWIPETSPVESNVSSSKEKVSMNDPSKTIIPMPGAKLQSKRVEIEEDEKGHTYESLFGEYLRGAEIVVIEDPYLRRHHQLANLLRLLEMLVRFGDARKVELTTGTIEDEAWSKLENFKRSLSEQEIDFSYRCDPALHDRRLLTDTGWEIVLGRGLDMYKRPDDFAGIGATDFALRPCYKTRVIAHRISSDERSIAAPRG